MLESDKVFAGSIPENYDRYIVPLIFERFAADLAQRAASLSPVAVLEIAAGTGVVTRASRRNCPRTRAMSSPTSTRRCSTTPLRGRLLTVVSNRRQADALALPFENAAFDLVCCQFGAMFFPDRLLAYREAKQS